MPPIAKALTSNASRFRLSTPPLSSSVCLTPFLSLSTASPSPIFWLNCFVW
ncbi:unnamed protein product [Coffea canephora]|uniref:Uncharacterized protein n=1 Tax=Coffea canephora TaxID=49390 RepID=A0A068TS34_COFCA|nr:unnamed protein product [Coffea canephora]